MEVHEPYIVVHPDKNGETDSIVLDGEREKCLRDCENERGEKNKRRSSRGGKRR